MNEVNDSRAHRQQRNILRAFALFRGQSFCFRRGASYTDVDDFLNKLTAPRLRGGLYTESGCISCLHKKSRSLNETGTNCDAHVVNADAIDGLTGASPRN